MRRVLVVQPYLAAYRSDFYRLLLPVLRAQGVELTVAAGKPDAAQAGRDDSSSMPGIVPTGNYALRLPGATLRWQASWRLTADYDGVVLEASGSFLDTYVAMLKRRKPVAVWGHIGSFTGRARAVDNMLEAWQLRRAAAVLAYTRRGRDAALARGASPERVFVLNNTIATDRLVAASASMTRQDAGAVLGIDDLEHRVNFAFIGGIDDSKRIDFLLDVLNRLQRLRPQVRLLVGGRGESEGLLKAAVERGQVVMLGRVGDREKAAMAKASVALLNPGRVGLLAVDSFALGLPIVTTAWPFHAPEFDYLTPGFDSVVTLDDPDSFANAVVRLADDRQAADQLRRAALTKAGTPSLHGMVNAFVDGVMKMLA